MTSTSPVILGYKSKKHFLRTYGIILGIGIFAFIIRVIKFDEFSIGFQLKIFVFQFFLISFSWESLRQVNLWLNKTMPFEDNIPKRIIVQLLIGSIIGLIVRSIIYFIAEPYIPFKLDKLFLVATWFLYAILPIGFNLGFFTAYFIDRWKDSLVRAERLEIEKSQVQFDNLKNQLNPHFLFNALTSLNVLITEDQQLATRFLQQLSKVYRYVLQNKEKNFVMLQTELDFIQHYVSLLETRFKNAITITFEIRTDATERAIVPVTLQILIENALKHNIVDKDRPLHIEIFTSGDYLVVSNNLQLRKRVETSNKLGLENLKSLYSFLTDRPLIIENTETRFSVKVPLV